MAISEVNAAVDIICKVKTVVDQIREHCSEESLARNSLTGKLMRLDEQQRQWEQLLKILPENHTTRRDYDELTTKLAKAEQEVSAVQKSNCCMRLWKAPSAIQLGTTLDDLSDEFNRLDDFQKLEEIKQRVSDEADRHKPSVSFSHDPKYVPIKHTLERVKKALESEAPNNVVLLWGGSGEGKTTLAKYLAVQYDERSRSVTPSNSSAVSFKIFTGGLAYIFCGKNADSMTAMRRLWADLRFELGTSSGQENDTDERKRELEEYKKRLMVRVGKDNNVLVILDDVWEHSFLEDLVVSSVHIKYLVTSQKSSIWRDAVSVPIRSPHLKESRRILANHIVGWEEKEFPPQVKDVVDNLLEKVENHPLIIANIATWIRWETVTDRGTWLDCFNKLNQYCIETADQSESPASLVMFGETYKVKLLASLTCEYALTLISEEARTLFYLHVMCTGAGVPENVLKLWFSILLGPKYKMLSFDASFSDLESRCLISVTRTRSKYEDIKIYISSSVHDLRRELLSEMNANTVDVILERLISSEAACASPDDRREEDLVIVLCFLYGDAKCREKAHSNLAHLINADYFDSGHKRYREELMKGFSLLLHSTFEEPWKQKTHELAKEIILYNLGREKLKDEAVAELLATPEASMTTCSILKDHLWFGVGYIPLTLETLLKTCDAWSRRGPKKAESDALDVNFYACVHALHKYITVARYDMVATLIQQEGFPRIWVKLLQRSLFDSLIKVAKPTAKRVLSILDEVCSVKIFRIKMALTPGMLLTLLQLLDPGLYSNPGDVKHSVKTFGRLGCVDTEIKAKTILLRNVFQVLTKLLPITPLKALKVLEKLAWTRDSAQRVILCPEFAEGLGRILDCRDGGPGVLSQAVRCLGTLSSFRTTRSEIVSSYPGLFQSLIQVIRGVREPKVLESAAIAVTKIISDEPDFKLHDSKDLLSVVLQMIELPRTKDFKISVGSHVMEFLYTLTSLEAICELLEKSPLLEQILQISTHDAINTSHVKSLNRIIERFFPDREVYKDSQITGAAVLIKEYNWLLELDGIESEIKQEVAKGLGTVSRRRGLHKVVSDSGAAALVRTYMDSDPLFFLSGNGVHVVEDIILQRSRSTCVSNPNLVADILRFYMAFTRDTSKQAEETRQEMSMKAIASLAYWKEIRDLLLSDEIMVNQLLSCVIKDATPTSLQSIPKIIHRVCCTVGNEVQKNSLLATALGRYASLLSGEREAIVEEAAVDGIVILGSMEQCRMLISSDEELIHLLLELLGEHASKRTLHGAAYLLSRIYRDLEVSKGDTQRLVEFMDEAVRRVATLASGDSLENVQAVALGSLLRLAFTEKDGEVIAGYPGAIHELLRIMRNVLVDSAEIAWAICEVVEYLTNCRTEKQHLHEDKLGIIRYVLQSYMSILKDDSHMKSLREVAARCLSDVLRYAENREVYIQMSDDGPALLRLIVNQEFGLYSLPGLMTALTLVETEGAKKLNLSTKKLIRGRILGRLMLQQYDEDVLEDIHTLMVDYPHSKSRYLSQRALVKVHMEHKDLAGALEDLNEAISSSPTKEFYWQERGVLKSIMQDYGGALVDLNVSLRICGDDYERLKHRANVKFQLGDEDGAIFDVQQAHCVRFSQFAGLSSNFKWSAKI